MTAVSSRRVGVAFAALCLSLFVVSSASAATLKGVFRIGTGSYIRLQQPNSGPFFSNPFSADANKTYTLITPGTEGGLKTGTVQAAPNPAFDSKGDSLAAAIIKPTNFAGILFGLATTSAPSISVSGSKLSGQVNGLVAEWNNQKFDQGAKVTGTYNAKKKTYVLTWSSLVHGGPFNGFTGFWRLQGTFSS